MYTINIWHAHPASGKDACETGEEFNSLEEMEEWLIEYSAKHPRGDFWVERICEGETTITCPLNEPSSDDSFDKQWRQECATEAGMLYGIDEYNDLMGWR